MRKRGVYTLDTAAGSTGKHLIRAAGESDGQIRAVLLLEDARRAQVSEPRVLLRRHHRLRQVQKASRVR